ncbi:pentapeptide repeat-containing protein, partial [Scytonema sp. PRP1]|uniref:pentapeptide repeat-containing protein n=1 Tax=Scytonema sp. PRP1 TaxID=3120513 RepID=UPI002FCF3D93
DLSGANLENALYDKNTVFPDKFNLTQQKMYLIGPNVNLTGARLTTINLSDVDLRGANFSRADLRGAYLNSTNFSRADLRGANLNGANLRSADLSGANLENALYDKNTVFPDKFNLTQQKMYLIGPNVNLTGARLTNINLIGAHLSGANLNSTNLSYADLSYADLSRANLSSANLNGANLNGANLRSADLSGANLSGAALGCYTFFTKNFTEKTICTNLKGVKNLTSQQIKAAKNWEQACYDPELRQQLNLPPKNPKNCAGEGEDK